MLVCRRRRQLSRTRRPAVRCTDADPATHLRDLLARRLVREGRYQEALPYFHLPEDAHFNDSDVRKHVTAYAGALAQATGSFRRVNRAQGLYRAAVLARTSGMEMMGYEAAPDYFITGGELGRPYPGFGQVYPGHCFITDGELSRFAASTAKPDLRLHYRFIAVQEAVQAADRPPRSQAFAAVLCHATDWMMNTARIGGDKQEASGLARKLYRRYVKEGPQVAWAQHFGRGCPEPDFESAARLPRTLAIRHARHFAGSHRWQLGLSFGGLIVALGASLAGYWRRRRAGDLSP